MHVIRLKKQWRGNYVFVSRNNPVYHQATVEIFPLHSRFATQPATDHTQEFSAPADIFKRRAKGT